MASVSGQRRGPGESLAEAAVRETLAESGIEHEVTSLTGICTDPRHVIHCTGNGQVRQGFFIVVTPRAAGSQLAPGSETSAVPVGAAGRPGWLADGPASAAAGAALHRAPRLSYIG
jgi:ADP-ribose pyrophosphatase YjhB (NUDIX family)